MIRDAFGVAGDEGESENLGACDRMKFTDRQLGVREESTIGSFFSLTTLFALFSLWRWWENSESLLVENRCCRVQGVPRRYR